jgi:hypothetical protein
MTPRVRCMCRHIRSAACPAGPAIATQWEMRFGWGSVVAAPGDEDWKRLRSQSNGEAGVSKVSRPEPAAAITTGRGRGKGTPTCATMKDGGRFRGSGTRPAMGSDCGGSSAMATSGCCSACAGGAEAASGAGVVGGAGQMSLVAAIGASGAVLGAGFAGGLAGGFDIANFAGAAGTGLGAGGATGALTVGVTLDAAGGALDVTPAAKPVLLAFAGGVLLAVFTAGAIGTCAVLASCGGAAGGVSVGIEAVCSGTVATGAAVIVCIDRIWGGPR